MAEVKGLSQSFFSGMGMLHPSEVLEDLVKFGEMEIAQNHLVRILPSRVRALKWIVRGRAA